MWLSEPDRVSWGSFGSALGGAAVIRSSRCTCSTACPCGPVLGGIPQGVAGAGLKTSPRPRTRSTQPERPGELAGDGHRHRTRPPPDCGHPHLARAAAAVARCVELPTAALDILGGFGIGALGIGAGWRLDGATRTLLIAVLLGAAALARHRHGADAERRIHPQGRGL